MKQRMRKQVPKAKVLRSMSLAAKRLGPQLIGRIAKWNIESDMQLTELRRMDALQAEISQWLAQSSQLSNELSMRT